MVHMTKQKAEKPLSVLPSLKFSLRCVLLANHSLQEFFEEPAGSHGIFQKSEDSTTRSRTIS